MGKDKAKIDIDYLDKLNHDIKKLSNLLPILSKHVEMLSDAMDDILMKMEILTKQGEEHED